ncbi:hypothetical protein BOTBODRAFT_29643 [Botryobasidium botryosum FD-172 SS1]|uniref:C2H2-type domain-containing protein n=1 Tax=Botryobasidium botryosum (strain FD-172 SS1) TaxID=930990 RepID=A0A067MZZ3_BOTB1|nr:hypothetical protein BOTBODRAFT_29643 [Botryobasidium botryosum FD-172 SS1]
MHGAPDRDDSTPHHIAPPPEDGDARALKKHRCVGCDNVFERPSSLKQHMLSHTGERPHPCQICGRRFSALSNLRRHINTCRQRLTGHVPHEQPEHAPRSPRDSPFSPCTVPPSARTRRPAVSKPKPTACRWLPFSLAGVHHSSLLSATPPFVYPLPKTNVTLPLPPVTPYGARALVQDTTDMYGGREMRWEERNSYETGVPSHPYHPTQWRNRLPGPGLLDGDELIRGATIARRWVF